MANLYRPLLTPSKAKPWPNSAVSSGSRHSKLRLRYSAFARYLHGPEAIDGNS